MQPSARQSTPSKPSTSYSTCKSSPISTTCQSTPTHSPTAQPTKVTASLQPQADLRPNACPLPALFDDC